MIINRNSIIFDGFGQYTEQRSGETITFKERGIYLPLSPKGILMGRERLAQYCQELDEFILRWFCEDAKILANYGPLSMRTQ